MCYLNYFWDFILYFEERFHAYGQGRCLGETAREPRQSNFLSSWESEPIRSRLVTWPSHSEPSQTIHVLSHFYMF